MAGSCVSDASDLPDIAYQEAESDYKSTRICGLPSRPRFARIDKGVGAGRQVRPTVMDMAQCISQLRIKSENGFKDVPCGRCGFCLQNRRKEWSFRLQQEAKCHESAFFATLTYSDENLTWGSSDNGDTYPILHKRDFQLFMKRLRKRQAKICEDKIKYYAVGEYGSNTNRPHYHALLFSLSPNLVNEIDKIWGQGHSHIGHVNNDTIDYVTKYVVNKYDYNHYLVPPFSCISNGIGLKHFQENRDRYSLETVVRNKRGYKQKLPRYYRDKLQRNRWTSEILSSQQRAKFEESRAEEIRKLSKSHADAEAYHFERQVHNNNRILKSVKKGGKF